jgi:hypothetical protein
MDISGFFNDAILWMVTTIVAPFIAIRFRSLWTHSSQAFHFNAKKGFDSLPSFWQKTILALYLEAKKMFPPDKVESAIDWTCLSLKQLINGKIDDIIIDAIRAELRKR